MSDEGLTASILDSVKKSLNIPVDVTVFDSVLIMHINTVFSKLYQLGVGPDRPFMIEGNEAEWDEFSTDPSINMVRTFVYLEVRLVFDPPSASVLTAIEKKRDELEWRLNVADDDPVFRTVQNGIDE